MVLTAANPSRPTLLVRHEGTAEKTGSAHLVGICGSGMRALSELLAGSGWSVTGSDLSASEAVIAAFARRGLRIHAGHQPNALPNRVDVLVYSPAVSPENPERQWALQLGIEQLSYSEMLGRLMKSRDGVCIAGTHGKSTTTAMTGCILTTAGLAPSVVVGAELREFGVSGWFGAGKHFVVESCEFNRSFLDLSPRHAAILSVEPDHFDCYPNFDETIAAFAAFAQQVPAGGSLLIPAIGDSAKAACVAAAAPIETFGLTAEADWWGTDLRPTREGLRFRVFHGGEFFVELSLRVPGRHNVENALAAAALGHRAGASTEAIREALEEFPGLRRRFEPIGSFRGCVLIDDYAHHPTAVATTLRTARERFPRRKLWCVFQPHQVSRTLALLDEFAQSLSAADRILVAPVYAAREKVTDEPEQVSLELARRIAKLGGNASYSAGLDRAVATLDHELRPGDVLITMGAGDIGRVHYEFTRRLQRNLTA